MLLPFLHDNQGWQDRLVQIQTRSGDGGGATAGTDGRAGDEKKSEDQVQKGGDTKP